MNYYHPQTHERITTTTPAAWMGKTEVEPPPYDPAKQGCFWRGTAWEIVEPEPVVPDPVPPIVVSPRQIRQALTRFNLRDQVEAAVSAGDQDLRDWWEFATQVEESHPAVIGMAQALGVSDTDLHALFVAAKAL